MVSVLVSRLRPYFIEPVDLLVRVTTNMLYRTIVLLLFSMGVKLGPSPILTEERGLREFQNRVL